jgi:hypothetical protein
MYDLIDRPVADLPPFERFLLRATRAWVHALTLAGAPEAATSGGFVDHGGADAATAFDTAMRVLDRGSTDTLVFQRPCHATVEETEAVVMALWRLVRDDRIAPARAAATGLVGGEAGALVSAMVRAAGQLG